MKHAKTITFNRERTLSLKKDGDSILRYYGIMVVVNNSAYLIKFKDDFFPISIPKEKPFTINDPDTGDEKLCEIKAGILYVYQQVLS